ncbi:MAG: hypothetical protein OEY14_11805 [Myxococcales bacterium]|nr:hypothetical protein [Myxococcales bacterium]
MISAELRFEGYDARSWTNLISLFAPGIRERVQRGALSSDAPEVGGREDFRREGILVVVVDAEDRVLSALHTARGRVRGLHLEALPQLAERYGAKRCVVLREGMMEELSERVGLRLRRDDDYATQWLVVLRCIRELEEAGQLRVHPAPLRALPVPSPLTLRRALDLVLPDEKAAVAVLWERGRIWTSAALRRRSGSLDLMAGPDLLSRWTGPLGGDFRRDYLVVSDAVARAVAPLHVGIFAEAHIIRDLLRSPDPGAWAAAVAVRDVIVHPMPAYLAVALGADVANAVARTSAQMLGGLDPLGLLAPLTSYLRSRINEVSSVSSALGFNPLHALARALRAPAEIDAGAEPPREP